MVSLHSLRSHERGLSRDEIARALLEFSNEKAKSIPLSPKWLVLSLAIQDLRKMLKEGNQKLEED